MYTLRPGSHDIERNFGNKHMAGQLYCSSTCLIKCDQQQQQQQQQQRMVCPHGLAFFHSIIPARWLQKQRSAEEIEKLICLENEALYQY